MNPVGPRSVYDESKRFAEATTAAYRRARGADAGIVRIFNTYGPRMRGHARALLHPGRGAAALPGSLRRPGTRRTGPRAVRHVRLAHGRTPVVVAALVRRDWRRSRGRAGLSLRRYGHLLDHFSR